MSVGSRAEKFNYSKKRQWTLAKVRFFFLFRPEIPLLSKFGPKNQNFQFKLKFGTLTNSNMQNLMVMFTFSIFDQKCPFFWIFGPKIQNSLKWNLVSWIIRICRVVWWCSFYCQNCHFKLKCGIHRLQRGISLMTKPPWILAPSPMKGRVPAPSDWWPINPSKCSSKFYPIAPFFEVLLKVLL